MDQQPEKTLIVIAGPTAVGKTGIAVDIARHYRTEIISADARQVFKEMNIGTAKPDKDDLQQVRHHFIASRSIHRHYSAGLFEKEADEKLAELFTQHEAVVMAGGSGMYIEAVLQGFDPIPRAGEGIRDPLNQLLEDQGLASLQDKLREVDPDYYEMVDRKNPHRLIRALEVHIETGKPYSSFLGRSSKKTLKYNVIKIALDRPREELYQRINLRMDQMLAAGLVEEAKVLLPYRHLPALQTVGYSEVFDFLAGKYDYAEMIRLLKRNSRRYAKRQLTWLRRDPEFKWLPPKVEEVLGYVEKRLSEKH